jgi:signal transduction histidine kinase
MLHQFVRTQEDERRRIARDNHDHFGQRLTALRFKLDRLQKMFENGDFPEKEKICTQVDDVKKKTEQLDRDVDFLAWDLRPASLDYLGLRLTLMNFVKEWARYTGVKPDFHTSGLGKVRLSGETETNLYRIAQEALNNILKHAKAKAVSVLLEKRKDTVVLIVEDDGIGFDVEKKLNRPKGLGLVGMKERAELIGGKFEIESAPRKGTTIFVRAPADTENNTNNM